MTERETSGQESDRRDCFRYEVEKMTLLLAWAEVAEIIPPVQGTSGFRRVMGEESSATKFVRKESSIRNISQSGLSLIVDCLPPGDRSWGR